jgi:hypothetical protein
VAKEEVALVSGEEAESGVIADSGEISAWE